MFSFTITVVLITIALTISLKRKKDPFVHLNYVRAMLCYAALSTLAARQFTSWVDFRYILSIALLPILAQHSIGLYPFQLANVFGIYHTLNKYGHDLGLDILVIALHSYLLFASFDKAILSILKDAKDIFMCTEERRLVGIQEIRDIVLADIKRLPERMRLANAAKELTFDTNEHLFLIRAIIRMTWRPMLPLYATSAIISMFAIASSVSQSRIMHCIDFPLVHSWYNVYMFMIIELALRSVMHQLDRIESFMNEEVHRAIGALKLHMFRLPLLNKGLQKDNTIHKVQYDIVDMFHYLQASQSIISSVSLAFAAFISLYAMVGWLALIPLGVACVQRLIAKSYGFIFGKGYWWSPDYYYRYDGKVDEIYHNIKSIKMFGWENLYTSKKLQEYWKRFNSARVPWHAPIAKISWFVSVISYSIIQELSSFLIFYFYLQSSSGSSLQLSVSNMFWINGLIKQMQTKINESIFKIRYLGSFIRRNYKIEKALKGSYVNTLPQYQINKTKAQDTKMGKVIDYSGASIYMDMCEFNWKLNDPVLIDVSLTIKQSELVAVVGKTGSGKSSLLLSICGEVEMASGTGAVVGSMALVEQIPWVMSGTLRENILFGRDYDEEYYNKVIYACALIEDINNWAKKDLTVIGERGINISGGQKTRLALARAVYSRADIYILDDPLSAVDAHVKRHILDHVIMDSGLLAGKIRIVSTNMQSLLPYFDKVLSLDGNKCVSVLQNTRQDYQQLANVPEFTFHNNDTSTKSNDGNDISQIPASLEDMSDKGNVVKGPPEITKRGWNNWDHAKFVLQLCGGPTMAIIVISALFDPVTQFVFDSYRLGVLIDMQGTPYITINVIQRFIFIEMLKQGSSAIITRFEKHFSSMISERYLHSRIKSMFIKQLLHAPLSFFDSTARQEISSAYNNGTEAMSTVIPNFLRSNATELVNVILTIYRVTTSAPQLLLFVPIFIWAGVKKESNRTRVNVSLRKIETQALIDQEKVNDIISDGQRLIRIFDVEKHFTEKYMDEKDKELRVQIPQRLFGRYSATLYHLWQDMILSLAKTYVIIQAQVFHMKISSVELDIYTGLAKTLADSVNDITSFKAGALRFKSDIEIFRRYIDKDGEKMFVENADKPEENWPSTGKIEFRNFSMKYREDLELVLKDVNLTIKPGEKIGIVGRTGAGKTSLTRALFRLIDSKTCDGSIVVDGQDIFSLNLGDLRPKLGIIPQEPTMFEGSFRQNLDPLLKYNIEDMWSAIIKCGIVENIEPADSHDYYSRNHADNDTLMKIKDWNEEWAMSSWYMRLFLYVFIENPAHEGTARWGVRPHGLNRRAGNSFSDGQQQIFGLCRLLMRNRKIVVLDEATANVDLETDQRMQKLIRSEFKDRTVLTIAHRLETIMNSDRVIVMENGRIAEIGPPTELLEKNGHFAELVKANDFGE